MYRLRLPRKCDYRTDAQSHGRTDAGQSDHYESLYAMLRRRHNKRVVPSVPIDDFLQLAVGRNIVGREVSINKQIRRIVCPRPATNLTLRYGRSKVKITAKYP